MSLLNLIKNNNDNILLFYPEKKLIQQLANELIQFHPNDQTWIAKVIAFKRKLEIKLLKKKIMRQGKKISLASFEALLGKNS